MRAYGSPFVYGVPPVVKNLLIINAIFLLAKYSLGQDEVGYRLEHWCALHWPGSPHFRIWQVVSHMFMHGDWKHWFGNMFILFMFGSSLELLWGGKRFLTFYVVCGIGASLMYLGMEWRDVHALEQRVELHGIDVRDVKDANIVAHDDLVAAEQELAEIRTTEDGRIAAVQLYKQYEAIMVGASGAIFGVLLGFGLMFPNEIAFVPGLYIPVPAKYLVLIIGCLEHYRGMDQPYDGIAHFAHLGGMLVGALLILHWKKRVIL